MRLVGDALLFDLDGTLVDSAASIERAWAGWATEHGLDLAELLRLMPGRPGHETMALVLPGVPAAQLLAEDRVLLDLQIADTADVVALPGAAELLGALPADGWAVVTACSRPLAEARLRAAGLPAPEVLVTPGDVVRGKPDPEGHVLAAARLGIAARRGIVLEDAPSGVLAGGAAGMSTVAVLTTHDATDLAMADLVVDGLDHLVLEGDGPFSLRAR